MMHDVYVNVDDGINPLVKYAFFVGYLTAPHLTSGDENRSLYFQQNASFNHNWFRPKTMD